MKEGGGVLNAQLWSDLSAVMIHRNEQINLKQFFLSWGVYCVVYAESK